MRAYLRKTGEYILYTGGALAMLGLMGMAVPTFGAVVLWIMGTTPDWGGLWQYILIYVGFFGGFWLFSVPVVAIACIPAVPRSARRLRAGVRRTKDRLLHGRHSVRGGRAKLRDLAALGSLGRAGRSAVHRALRPPPPPVWPEKPRWLGLAVRNLRRFGRGLRRFVESFTSRLWKTVGYLITGLLSYDYLREGGLLPREFYTNVLPWVAIPLILLVSLWAGVHGVRHPNVLGDPVLLLGTINPQSGTPPRQAHTHGSKERVVRSHYDRPNRTQIEIGVRSAMELHADGSMTPCQELHGVQKIRCSPAKARSVLDHEGVVLICQRKEESDLMLVDRFARFAAQHCPDA